MAEEFDVCLLLDVAPELDFDSHRQSELAKGAIRSEKSTARRRYEGVLVGKLR
ncbi:MAG: hypothetical protein K0Q83_3472 [Deltaproteobacteria bacterium]|nr:hypothetical protein [Deltaproteobacteria bacterium]